MFFPHGEEIEIYRKPEVDNWGNYSGVGDTTGIPMLYGHVYVETLESASVGPRVDEPFPKKEQFERTSYSGSTLFCEVDDDVRKDDLVKWTDASGRVKIYKVEGLGAMDYCSPFSGYSVGKEVYIGVSRHGRG